MGATRAAIISNKRFFPRCYGPEFAGRLLDQWAYLNKVELDFSRPAKPTDNALAESYNAIVRKECLGQHWFLSLEDAGEKIEIWRCEYNEVRPHGAIGDRVPISMLTRLGAASQAAYQLGILT